MRRDQKTEWEQLGQDYGPPCRPGCGLRAFGPGEEQVPVYVVLVREWSGPLRVSEWLKASDPVTSEGLARDRYEEMYNKVSAAELVACALVRVDECRQVKLSGDNGEVRWSVDGRYLTGRTVSSVRQALDYTASMAPFLMGLHTTLEKHGAEIAQVMDTAEVDDVEPAPL